MTSVEQHKMVQRLKQVVNKMNTGEKQSFEMMAKRDRDDEDLDVITMGKLKQLYQKFYPKNSKKDIEERWKKIAGEN